MSVDLGMYRPAPTSRAPAEGEPGDAGVAIEGLDFEISPRVARGALHNAYEPRPDEPQHRPLRIFAVDPTTRVDEGGIAVVNVPFERLEPGPKGALIEVRDASLADETQQNDLDLNHPRTLIERGREPSATDPLFRAQMTYAVCSITYAAFKRALGRDVSWGFDRVEADGAPARLVIRPALNGERNAYYDGARGELRFGAFRADTDPYGRNVAEGLICTALSHDIVVHEMSHALLDGLRARFTVPTNPDVPAFHEAFADLIAVFQRFTYRDVVRHAIAVNRGELRKESALTDIGAQFAQASGLGNELRSALLGTSADKRNDPEPHERGKVLLAAVFRAFTRVYDRKKRRLVRLATNGSGELPPGELPELLCDALTDVACKLAGQFLNICIRAIDYCPPVDITFGEFLRAVITADSDLVPEDPWHYREEWIDAFGEYKLVPAGVRSLSQQELTWRGPDTELPRIPALSFAALEFHGDPGHPASAAELRRQALALGRVVADPAYCRTFGVVPRGDPELQSDRVDPPQIESLRSSRRIGPDGQIVFDLVGEVTQRRVVRGERGDPTFSFYGGSTVIIDPLGSVRYVVRKTILQTARMQAQADFLRAEGRHYWLRAMDGELLAEPQGFRLMHAITRAMPRGGH